MAWYKYIWLKLSDIPADIIEIYNLNKIATLDGYVYCKIQKGMYGLSQAGITDQELLADQLKLHGYSQSKTTPGLWKKLLPHCFLPCLWQFWSKVCWQGECATDVGHNTKMLQVFVRLGWGTILRTHYKVGLQWAQGAPLDANICLEGPQMFSATPTLNPTGPATSQCQEDIQHKKTICKTN
jgi:hypothetical protein